LYRQDFLDDREIIVPSPIARPAGDEDARPLFGSPDRLCHRPQGILEFLIRQTRFIDRVEEEIRGAIAITPPRDLRCIAALQRLAEVPIRQSVDTAVECRLARLQQLPRLSFKLLALPHARFGKHHDALPGRELFPAFGDVLLSPKCVVSKVCVLRKAVEPRSSSMYFLRWFTDRRLTRDRILDAA
jgi:hypothetical protein